MRIFSMRYCHNDITFIKFNCGCGNWSSLSTANHFKRITGVSRISVQVRTSNSTPLQQHCHEQPHHGTCEASDNARGSEPPNYKAHQLSTTTCADDNFAGSFLDKQSSPIRHSLWTATTWFPVTKAWEVGWEQGVFIGQGWEILLVDRDGPGNVCCAGTILQTSVSPAVVSPFGYRRVLIHDRYTIYYPFEKVHLIFSWYCGVANTYGC